MSESIPIPLTGNDIRDLFLKPSILVLRDPKHKLPSDMGFQHIAVVVNKLRREDRAAHDAKASKIQQVLEATTTLENFVSCSPTCMLEKYTQHRNYPDGTFDVFAAEERIFPLTLKRDLGKVKRALERAVANVPLRNKDGTWHDYIGELEHAFRLAMRTTNADAPFARSNKGPLPRFLSAAVPLISGKRAGLDATVKALDRKYP